MAPQDGCGGDGARGRGQGGEGEGGMTAEGSNGGGMAEDAGVPAAGAARFPLRLVFDEVAEPPTPSASCRRVSRQTPRMAVVLGLKGLA